MISLTVTNCIIGINIILSLIAFQNREFLSRMLFNPFQVVHRKEYLRVIGHAFIHADWIHLFFNMYVLYSFGNLIERIFTSAQIFKQLFPTTEYWGVSNGYLFYILLYLGGILFAALPAIKKHKDDPSYNSLGASGAVSAVVMAFIVLLPTTKLQLFFIPLDIPAFILGAAYLGYEYYMSKRGRTGIAHDAHFWGAIYGLVLLLILRPYFGLHFIREIGAFIGLI